jgi:predicted RNase H-like HicB family nuclease
MNLQNEEERQAAAQTLKEVMQKLEEAWRLARKLEEQTAREHIGAGRG